MEGLNPSESHLLIGGGVDMTKGTVVFIVGTRGSGKSYLVCLLPDRLTFETLSPCMVDRVVPNHMLNIALDLNSFTNYCLIHLHETVKALIEQGKHVYLMCNPAIYERVKCGIFVVVNQDRMLNQNG